MTVQEVVTASDTKFVEVDRVQWLLFLGTVNPPDGHPLVETHRELTAGSMKATAETVIVYRSQAKELLELTGVKVETAP